MENPFRKIYDLPQYKFPYRYLLASFPYILDVEVTNACNMDCIMCERQLMKRKVGFMDFNMYKKIVDEAAKEGALGIRLIRYGEPLLHKQIFDIIDYAKEKGMLIHITTNGLLLTEEVSKKLIDLKLDSIIFSMQGTNKEEYEKMRNTSKYGLLVNNIRTLVNLRKKLNSDKPYITVTTTVLDETKEEINSFLDYWKSIVDHASYWYTYLLRLKGIKRIEHLYEKQKWQQDMEKRDEVKGVNCSEVRTKLSINWDGTVTACCSDYDNELLVGSLDQDTLKEIWNSKKLNNLRELLQKDRNLVPFCRLCTNRF